MLRDPSISAETSRPSCPSATCPLLSLGLFFVFGPLSCSTPGGSAASPGLVFRSALGFGCWTGSGPSPGSCEGLLSWQWHRGQVSCTYSHFLRQPAWKKWLHGVITAVFISWKTHTKKRKIVLYVIPFLSSCPIHLMGPVATEETEAVHRQVRGCCFLHTKKIPHSNTHAIQTQARPGCLYYRD